MDYFSFLLIFGAVLTIIFVVFRRRMNHMYSLTANIPGIERLPWKGLIEHFFAKNKDCIYNLYNVIETCAAPFPDLGKGYFGPFCLIDIRKPEYIKKILNSDKCNDRASFYSFPYKTGLLISDGELWKRHRKILNPVFNTNKLNKFMPIVNEKARKLCDVLDASVDKDEFNIVRILSAMTLENLLRSSFGLEKDFINNPFDEFFTIVKKEAYNIGKAISNLIYLFIPKFHRKNQFTKFCREIFKEAEKESKDVYNGGNLNFIEILLANKNCLSEKEILDEVNTMILAGNGSTALTMATVLLMLAMHEEVQEKVFEELKSVFYGCSEDVDSVNIKKLEYLDMVVKETMRLFPVAPLIGRRVSEDLILDDNYTLPKGVDIFIRIIDVQRNPALWGDDAHQFRPERFLPEEKSKVHPYAFIPFSGGSRNCIGYRYAENVVKIVLCHILRRFKVGTSLRFEDLKLEISFVLRISQNYMIKLQKRNLPC